MKGDRTFTLTSTDDQAQFLLQLRKQETENKETQRSRHLEAKTHTQQTRANKESPHFGITEETNPHLSGLPQHSLRGPPNP
ncbi:Hypothetical predicted protein, partial [Pelobates cultripes]